MAAKIIYADDEARYRNLIKMFLSPEGYEVVCFENGEAVLDYLDRSRDADLILLDVMMPGLDGWETCRAIRSVSRVPVIMITALDDTASEVQGMDIGADDYVSKPFAREVLLARIRRLLARTRQEQLSCFEAEGIRFIDAAGSIVIPGTTEGTAETTKGIKLTPREYDLFKYLVLNKTIILSRDQILNGVWGFDYDGDPRTVDTHIKSLRARLGVFGKRIKTVRNRGYVYSGDTA